MKLLLDTNIVSYWMRADKKILRRLKALKPCDLYISTVTLAEILYGIAKSPVRKKERRNKIETICSQLELLPFDRLAAEKYAAIRTGREKKGIPISERDMQIASIALANNMGVVTHNVKEFERIPGLEMEDWKEDS